MIWYKCIFLFDPYGVSLGWSKYSWNTIHVHVCSSPVTFLAQFKMTPDNVVKLWDVVHSKSNFGVPHNRLSIMLSYYVFILVNRVPDETGYGWCLKYYNRVRDRTEYEMMSWPTSSSPEEARYEYYDMWYHGTPMWPGTKWYVNVILLNALKTEDNRDILRPGTIGWKYNILPSLLWCRVWCDTIWYDIPQREVLFSIKIACMYDLGLP